MVCPPAAQKRAAAGWTGTGNGAAGMSAAWAKGELTSKAKAATETFFTTQPELVNGTNR